MGRFWHFDDKGATMYIAPTLSVSNWVSGPSNVKISFVSQTLHKYLTAEYTRIRAEQNKVIEAENAELLANGITKQRRLKKDKIPLEDQIYRVFPIDIRPVNISEEQKKLSSSDYKGLRFIGNYRTEDIGPLFRIIKDMYGYDISEEQLNKYIGEAQGNASYLSAVAGNSTEFTKRNHPIPLCPEFHGMQITYNAGPLVVPETGDILPNNGISDNMLFGNFTAREASEIIYAGSLAKKKNK